MNQNKFDQEIGSRLESENWDEQISKSVISKRKSLRNQKILFSLAIALIAGTIFLNSEPIQYYITNLFFDDSQLFIFEPINEISFFLSE